MKYTFFQKIISGFLIFTVLFSFTFRFPFFSFSVFADDEWYYDLVSILVEEKIYRSVKSRVERYAEDIQKKLVNTKVVILPTPSDSSYYKIASLNEWLYFEGVRSLEKVSFSSKLVGTIIVWKLPLPLVYDSWNFAKSVVPYVDFEKKAYMYNRETWVYEKDEKNFSDLTVDIWHGFITPNTWNEEEDIDKINDYFDKNHDFYEGQWNFETSKWVVNGKKDEEVLSDYKPFVFYYDQFREKAALDITKYAWYKALQENLEDISYNRFSKELAEKVKNAILGTQSDEISDLIKKVDPSLDISSLVSWPDLSRSSDIATRYVIKNVVKNFLSVFNSSMIGDIRKNVYNAGRYNEGGETVNVDVIPFLITTLDQISSQILLDSNKKLEDYIDDLVINRLESYIAIPTEIVYTGSWSCSKTVNTNFLYGKQASAITNASECTIYRGNTNNSWTLVEANKWYNIKTIQADIDLCGTQWSASWIPTSWYWGGNSWLNLDMNTIQSLWEFVFKWTPNTKNAIISLYDPAVWKKIEDVNKVPSPTQCFNNNLLLTLERVEDTRWESSTCLISRQAPINWNNAIPNNRCSVNNISYNYTNNFNTEFKTFTSRTPLNCEIHNLYLNDSVIKTVAWNQSNGGETCPTMWVDYKFKKITSHVFHKSPTALELKGQIETNVSPNLPIDKDRYIDFYDQRWNYRKINYPYLFRVQSWSIEWVNNSLKALLDSKSSSINAIINSSNPSSLSWMDLQIYTLLKKNNYNGDSIDLYAYLKNITSSAYEENGDAKPNNYLDLLVFSIFWNNLASVWDKYKFIFENYLSDEFGWNNFNFHLPKNKKAYEIAYLWAPWDAQNMYIKLDPEDAGEHPYADIISKNISLNSSLFSQNITGAQNNNADAAFKCSPPDGVPLWEWIPAIQCRLADMLPPKIGIKDTQCGVSLFSEEEKSEYEKCSWDVNKNGVNDCSEQSLGSWKIDLQTSSSRLFYNKQWELKAFLKNSEWKDIVFDNQTKVFFRVDKIEVPNNPNTPFAEWNIKVVYDASAKNELSQKELEKYIRLWTAGVVARNWIASTSFSVKWNDANIYLSAYLQVKDLKGVNIISLKSISKKVEVRGDRLFWTAYTINTTESTPELLSWENEILASEYTNLYVVDDSLFDINTSYSQIHNNSLAKEKLVFSLSNFSKNWNKLNLLFPLTVSIEMDWKKIVEDTTLVSSDMRNYKSLWVYKTTGEYEITFTDSSGNTVKKNFSIAPEVATRADISLGTNIISDGGNVSTNLISLYDMYDNVTIWNIYSVEGTIQGDGVLFYENNSKSLSFSTLEWYRAFRLKSTDTAWFNTLEFVFKDDTWKKLFEVSKNIRVIDDLSLSIDLPQNNLVVWGWEYIFKVQANYAWKNEIETLKTRIYATIDKKYGAFSSPYFTFEGQSDVKFTVGTIAQKWVKIEFQIEWDGKIYEKYIDILPEKPVKLDIALSKDKIEATSLDSVAAKVELKDRYGNLVYTDNTTAFQVEILDRYKKIISTNSSSQVASKWAAYFNFTGTNTPWTAYFKVTASPSLDANSFQLPWTPPVTITPVSENVGKIESFYFWKEEKIVWKKYNALYTTLLWSQYWDISQEKYLAGSILFDKDNRALAVTSLLNNPFKYNDILTLGQNWSVSVVTDASDLSQSIEVTPSLDSLWNLELSYTNSALWTYIWEISYVLDWNNLTLQKCDIVKDGISSCIKDTKKSGVSISPLSQSYTVLKNEDGVALKNTFGQVVLSVWKNWKIFKNANISLVLDKEKSEYLQLYIQSGDTNIWKLIIYLKDPDFSKTTDKWNYETFKTNLKNTIIAYTATSLYSFREIHNSNTTIRYLYYNDPFSSDYKLNSFSEWETAIYENFLEEKWVGWEWWNKTLLSFSAWESVWNAVKNYQSFGVITLWDPVVSLKKITKNLSTSTKKLFDNSVGELIASDSDIVNYKIFDYNSDNRDDILVIKSDGYLSLFEWVNTSKKFNNLWNLAYVWDKWKDTLWQVGDFTWDGYDDIFWVNSSGKPFLLNNTEKDFTRIDLKNNFALSWKIKQTRAFDMDKDGKSDIVTLDEEGDIHIFYGGGVSNNPEFTKLLAWSGFWIVLSPKEKNTGWLVYYDGVYQLPEEWDNSKLLAKNEDYMAAIKNNTAGDLNEETINESFFDNLMFVRIPVSNEIGVSLNTTTSSEYANTEATIANNMMQYISDYSGQEIQTNATTYKTFVKSEYAAWEKMQVTKTFSDVNGWLLKGGDKVKVSVTLKNTGSTQMKNIQYIEKTEENFFFDIQGDTQFISSKPVSFEEGPFNYDFTLKDFTLSAGEAFTFSYNVETYPFSFWYIQVWLFETGELWDDIYGDIIVKANEKNCGQKIDIYRSSASRMYERWEKQLTCEGWDTNADKNNNGIKDELEELLDAEKNNDTEALTQFAKDALNKLTLDSDNDGIPDDEDLFPNMSPIRWIWNTGNGSSGWSNNAVTISLWTDLSDTVNDFSEGVDTLLEWLSCWFGGGSCFASPMNWAPLAPGNDPTIMGFPIGDGLNIGEWIPIFSALTWISWPYCTPIPTVWPVSPFSYPGWTCWGTLWAGWYLWTMSPANFLRIFVTPTITWAVWTAICFGGPAILAGRSNPPGFHPIVPGWNCIVAAKPLTKCGQQDNPAAGLQGQWYPQVQNWDFWVINGNCSEADYKKLKKSSGSWMTIADIQNYINYKKTGYKNPSLDTNFKELMSRVSQGNLRSGFSWQDNALINMNGGGENDMSLDIGIDTSALTSGNLSKAIKIDLKRVWPFPDFLMEWVTRQLEEVVTKLTDFPTLFVILPDFSWLLDDRWGNFSENVKNAFNKDKDISEEKEKQLDAKIDVIKSSMPPDCTKEGIACAEKKMEIVKLQWEKITSGSTVTWINQVYKFLSTLPLIAIEPQVVNINVPWIDKTSLDKAIKTFNNTKKQWEQEIERASNTWSLWATCSWTESEKKECEKRNEISSKLILDARGLISSLEKNIEILEWYKKFPEQLRGVIAKKEDRLEQVLCNIETIAQFMWGRISKNGKRFKAWVELYILIKAILKTWQIIPDIFLDYEASCHECKNERGDLMTYIFKIISMVIPKIPIVKFPKWPDIILDLHNIRAGMIIYMPEFKFSKRPIILPVLPNLFLPDVPSLTLKLPTLPLLPEFELPVLPDLPVLPMIELPDLPPPPKVPKLFPSLEWIIDILKLITKAMCILKSSPFVPEWRAWDQIAFMTERSGYLSLDFLDISLPQFTYPFIDAIKITTYVNFEVDNEFVVEMVRQTLEPLNVFTNNFTHIFSWLSISDIDLSELTPQDIQLEIDLDGWVNSNVDNLLNNAKEEGKKFFNHFALNGANNIQKFAQYLEKEKDETLTLAEVRQKLEKDLASKTLINDPALEKYRDTITQALAYDFKQEDILIESLVQDNAKKFELLHTTISAEINKTKKQKSEMNTLFSESSYKEVFSNTEKPYYTDVLSTYNLTTITNTYNLLNAGTSEKDYLTTEWQKLISEISTWLQKWSNGLSDSSKILAAVDSDISTWNTTSNENSCSIKNADGNQLIYKWIYITQDGRSYRLFDYIDELNWKEELSESDYDMDGDTDLFYMMNGEIFLKTNNKETANEFLVNTLPLTVSSDDNKFYNSSRVFYPSVNGIHEAYVANGAINLGFYDAWSDQYRVNFYNRVDKSNNLNKTDYTPYEVKQYIIDGFVNNPESFVKEENEKYTLSSNVARLWNIWNVGSIRFRIHDFKNIKEDIENNLIVTLNAGTPVYSWIDGVRIWYIEAGTEKNESNIEYVFLSKYSNIAFNENISIVSVGSNLYVRNGKQKEIQGQDILPYVGLPIFSGTRMEINTEGVFDDSTHLDIIYGNNSELNIDFRDTYGYQMYNLWEKADEYFMGVNISNDYYYAKIHTFKDDDFSTTSNQILLSPQFEADRTAPDITLSQVIKIPVYQEKTIDFSQYIYEESWITGIKDFYFDFDLTTDSDTDGDKTNDRDNVQTQITKNSTQLLVKFGAYQSIMNKKIGINVIDINENRAYKTIDFEVYSPTPFIQLQEWNRVEWMLSETLTNEPVNLYRYRGGIISKIADDSWVKVNTNDVWVYTFDTSTADGISIRIWENEIATISEKTGYITLKKAGLSFDVTPSNDETVYPQIHIKEWNTILYSQSFHLSKEYTIVEVGSQKEIGENWMYLQLYNDEYDIYTIADGVPVWAGTVVIYDTSDTTKKPLFTLFKDGRIKAFEIGGYSLEYVENNTEYIAFILKKNAIEIAKVIYKIDWNFIIQ